jgi:hypothetical protein
MEYKNEVLIIDQPAWLLGTKALLVTLMLAGNYLGAEVLFNTVARQLKSTKVM